MMDLRLASKMALEDEPLADSLRQWHESRGYPPLCLEDGGFYRWLDSILSHVADQIATWYGAGPIPEEDVICALRLQAMGDPQALDESRSLEDSFESDVNCYIEEGVVFSNIWIRGRGEVEVRARAERMAADMNAVGYFADVWVDDESPCSATVNAQIDFPLYMAMQPAR